MTRYPLYRRLGGPQDRYGRAENFVLTGIRSPDGPARSQSLYRLSYRAHRWENNKNKFLNLAGGISENSSSSSFRLSERLNHIWYSWILFLSFNLSTSFVSSRTSFKIINDWWEADRMQDNLFTWSKYFHSCVHSRGSEKVNRNTGSFKKIWTSSTLATEVTGPDTLWFFPMGIR
jgi:hypothetical protein